MRKPYEHSKHRKLSHKDVWILWSRGYIEQDDQAKQYLLENYIPYVLSIAGKRCGDDAKYDVAHDVLAYLSSHLRGFDPGKGNIISYINGAFRNVLVVRATRLRRNADMLGDVKAIRINKAPRSPVDVLNGREYRHVRLIALCDALEVLDKRERRLVMDRFVKERNLRDLAKEEGMNDSTLYHQLQRMLDKMRVVVSKYKVDLNRA